MLNVCCDVYPNNIDKLPFDIFYAFSVQGNFC